MYKKFLLLISLLIFFLFNFCSSPTEPKNHPPEIKDIVLNESSITRGSYVYITAIAIDTDGDSLQYYWFASDGRIHYVYIRSNPTMWYAPSEEGIYTVSCSVSDGKSLDTKSIDIIVN